MKLMGLKWSDFTDEILYGLPQRGRTMQAETEKPTPGGERDVLRQIRAAQRENGGWAQRDDMQPDAYATGLSLYAFHVAGVPATDPAYVKGVRYLMRNQYQDGSWFVRSRAFPTQPYFETGYPFGNNQFLSAAAASWSAAAIAFTLPAAQAMH